MKKLEIKETKTEGLLYIMFGDKCVGKMYQVDGCTWMLYKETGYPTMPEQVYAPTSDLDLLYQEFLDEKRKEIEEIFIFKINREEVLI